MENKNKLIESSISSARLHFRNSQYGKSFAYYLLMLKLSPERKHSFLTEFGDVFREWVRELQSQNRNNDVFEAYEQAMDAFPENEWVYDVMGSHLYKLGFDDEAFQYFQQALQLNPNLHSARENVFNLSNALVERWHFRMLNDRGRNLAFQEAIRRAIKTSKGSVTVLDIGAGTGILSMFAVQAGAAGVYACEMSKTMTRVAQDVLQANQMADKIQLFQIKSTAMEIPEHIPSRVSIVVTETLDSGLLGEGILDTVHHAWEHLLQPPNELGDGGRVIPGRATVFAMFIECQHIRKSHRLICKSIGSVDFGGLVIVSPCVRMTAGPIVTDISSSISPEPYTSEDLSSIPGGYTPLSNSFKVKDFNFNNPEEVESLRGTESQPNSLVVPIVKQGTIDAIVMWFDLELDTQTSISTSPWSKGCWENAVYPINTGDLKGIGDVCCSDCVHFDVIFKDNHLAFENIEVKSVTKKAEKGEFQIMTQTENSESNETVKTLHASHSIFVKTKDISSSIEYCSNALSTSGSNHHHHVFSEVACHKSLLEETTKSNKVFIMDEKDILTLNDYHYQLQICEAIKKAVNDTLSSQTNGRDDDNECELGNSCQVLDISEGISLATLHAAKSGADRIHVCNQKSSNLDLLLHLSNQMNNRLGTSDIQTLIAEHQNDPLWWDFLVVDIIEPCGLLRQNIWQDIVLVRDTILKPDGIIIPEGITFYAMCIDSSWIMENSSVISNERTLDFDIKPFINSFKVPTHPGIAFSMLQCTQLSTAIELTHIDLRKLDRSRTPAILKIQQEQYVMIKSDGCMTAFVYWFDVKLYPGQSVNTLDPTTHFRQSVYILPEQIQVSAGDNIKVVFLLEDSSISFKVSI